MDQILDLDQKNRKLIQEKETLAQEKKSISKKQDKSLFEKSKEISEKILVETLEALIKRVKDKFSWLENAPQEVEDVLVEMSYQMGVSGVSKFKNALKYMEHNNWTRAAEEMLDSKWHRQTPNRAKELSSIIRGLDE